MREVDTSSLMASHRHLRSLDLESTWENRSEYDASVASSKLPQSFETWLLQAEPFFERMRHSSDKKAVFVSMGSAASCRVASPWTEHIHPKGESSGSGESQPQVVVLEYRNAGTITPSSGEQGLASLIAECVRLTDLGFQGGLNGALRDLGDIGEEAEEKQIALPSDEARQNAESLLFAMYRIYPRQFSVYPSPEGDVVLETTSAAGDSLIIVCYSDGRLLCLVCCGQSSRRARYENAEQLPDGFLREALLELATEDAA